MEIRILRKQGKSLRAIAREAGVAVNTVRKYLAEGKPPKYKRRPIKASKLTPFEPYLKQRIDVRGHGLHALAGDR